MNQFFSESKITLKGIVHPNIKIQHL